jgi:hypothetical protein
VLASEEGAAPEACGAAVQRCRGADVASITRALDELLAEPARRVELATLGRAHAARFGTESLARAHVALYAAVLAESRRR